MWWRRAGRSISNTWAGERDRRRQPSSRRPCHLHAPARPGRRKMPVGPGRFAAGGPDVAPIDQQRGCERRTARPGQLAGDIYLTALGALPCPASAGDGPDIFTLRRQLAGSNARTHGLTGTDPPAAAAAKSPTLATIARRVPTAASRQNARVTTTGALWDDACSRQHL